MIYIHHMYARHYTPASITLRATQVKLTGQLRFYYPYFGNALVLAVSQSSGNLSHSKDLEKIIAKGSAKDNIFD